MKRRSLLSLCALILCISLVLSVGVAAIGASYGLYVEGVEVTTTNAADVLGDGTVRYDATRDILYLDGAKIEGSTAGIESDGDLTIYFDGKNTVEAASIAIDCGGDLELFGNDDRATLTIDAEFYGIKAVGTVDFEYSNVDIFTTGRRNGCAVLAEGKITLTDCDITDPKRGRVIFDKVENQYYIGLSTGEASPSIEIEVDDYYSSSSSSKPGWGSSWDDFWDDCDCSYWDNCDCSYWCDCDCYYCDCDDDWYYDDDCDCSYGRCDCDYFWCDCDCWYCDCDDDWYYDDCDCDPWETCYYCDRDCDDWWTPSRWYGSSSILCHDFFSDISKYDPFYEDVIYVYNKGLMNGVGENKFDPYGTATRGMIVTVLYRYEREPGVPSTLSFPDVDANAYYAKAVKWAAANQIVTGYDNGNFGPNDVITREQLISIIYRYAKSEGYKVSSSSTLYGFEDSGKVSEYALPAYKWANAKGYLSGYNLQPQAAAPRHMIATLLHDFMLDY